MVTYNEIMAFFDGIILGAAVMGFYLVYLFESDKNSK